MWIHSNEGLQHGKSTSSNLRSRYEHIHFEMKLSSVSPRMDVWRSQHPYQCHHTCSPPTICPLAQLKIYTACKHFAHNSHCNTHYFNMLPIHPTLWKWHVMGMMFGFRQRGFVTLILPWFVSQLLEDFVAFPFRLKPLKCHGSNNKSNMAFDCAFKITIL